MIAARGFACAVASIIALAATGNAAAENRFDLGNLTPVMIDVSDRDWPSIEEWSNLHNEIERVVIGTLADFRSQTITFQDTRYFTANAAEGTLASYGKLDHDKRYDRFGLIEGVQFSAEQNSWKKRQVVNAAALQKLAGNRFVEFAGCEFGVAAAEKRMIDVTFVGTQVPKDEAVRRLNADVQALEYFAALQDKYEQFARRTFKPIGMSPPPRPKVVLANVVMVNGKFAKAMEGCADGKLQTAVIGPGVELKVCGHNGETTRLLSPVIRCYRTYSVDFKTDPTGRRTTVTIRDRDGQPHQVPQIFDLTPDL